METRTPASPSSLKQASRRSFRATKEACFKRDLRSIRKDLDMFVAGGVLTVAGLDFDFMRALTGDDGIADRVAALAAGPRK